MPIEKNRIWLSAIMGVLIGDALGVPVQFMTREELVVNPVTGMRPFKALNHPAGYWSDDGSLTLAILHALIGKKGYDLEAIADNFVSWLDDGEFTPCGYAYDIGRGCKSGISVYRLTKKAKTSGDNSCQNNGNGSLMRTMPMSLFFSLRRNSICTSDDEAIAAIHEVSGITHRHIRSLMACGLHYFCVKHILSDREKKSLQICLQEGLDEGFKYYGQSINNIPESLNYSRLYDLETFKMIEEAQISTSGYVVDTFEAVIWNLITTSSFEDALLQAVNMGDDADTVGAITGGLAGLYYGYDDIPKEWIETISQRDFIEKMCRLVAEL